MMINYYDEGRVLAVLQLDHSRMAGYLAAHWGNDQFQELHPFTSMVVAAQEHDSGWWDWEIKPTLTSDGYPIDYQGSTKHLGPVKLELYRNAIDRVGARDPYAGYIVLLHQVGLLTQGGGLLPRIPDFSKGPGVPEFLAEQENDRQDLLETLRRDPRYREAATDEHLWHNYKMMEVFDQFAQFVCNRYPFDSDRRQNGPSHTLSDAPIPTRMGEPDTTISIDVVDATKAIVRPYPFSVDPLRIDFQARLLPATPFESEAAFHRAFYKAERVNVSYTLHAA